ncbi:CvfD/Ygs/GSP13 family RNA-binding post-transcriptional regulator [Companilactobacillus halodurans]|uniref:S1 RNA-binding domain-containing protein n=1 Tax=Companilactobacillus halodurans TaxID=2584183 RepID=A0A5P0ZV64_9LACO|nr:CvfD/Ygs/GSP13 family RNA-binding post-transcriptional regulator [Companilactobacillus halodurans]MQS76520.1 S1 RNA-binding domain-containing protein [Companilactobacillus halodurans]MQS96901.1 S1 RNA-binding domain-containing protein [Companilactobacillus halodurans]
MRIGDKITGTISGVQSYGVFVKIDDTHQGLIHISELKHGFVSDLKDKYQVGDKVKVVVMGIDEYTGKISLSIRALHEEKIGRPILHKHFWTNYRDKIGYKTIAKHKKAWVDEAMARISDKKQKNSTFL